MFYVTFLSPVKKSLFNISHRDINILSSDIGSIFVNTITSDKKVTIKAKNYCSTWTQPMILTEHKSTDIFDTSEDMSGT